MTRVAQTFVDVDASESRLELESRNAQALGVSADLVDSAVAVGATAGHTDMIGADLTHRAVAVA